MLQQAINVIIFERNDKKGKYQQKSMSPTSWGNGNIMYLDCHVHIC